MSVRSDIDSLMMGGGIRFTCDGDFLANMDSSSSMDVVCQSLGLISYFTANGTYRKEAFKFTSSCKRELS